MYLIGDAGDERFDVDGRGARELARGVRAFQTPAGFSHGRPFAATKRAGFHVRPPPIQQTPGTLVHDSFGVLRDKTMLFIFLIFFFFFQMNFSLLSETFSTLLLSILCRRIVQKIPLRSFLHTAVFFI